MTSAIYNHKAERAVLGAIIRSVDSYFSVSEQLRADHFYLAEHQQIFGVVRDICESSQRLAPSLICARLPATNEGGVAVESTIGILLKEAEDIDSPLDFVEIIKADWKHRKLKEFAAFVGKVADNPTKLADEKLLDIHKHLEHIDDASSEMHFTSFGEAAQMAADETAQNYQSKGKVRIGILTGIPELDDLIGPIMPGFLMTILAQSGHAKTALVTQILRAAATPSLDTAGGQPSLFISMEMKALEIARRVMAADLGIETKQQRMGDVTEGQYRDIAAAAKFLSNLPIIFDDRGQMTIEEVATAIRKAHRLHKIKIAAVDNLKQIKPSRANWTEVQTIANGTMVLKAVAKELNIPIIQLAQVTREGAKRENSWRPRDGDAFGGGAIKENSDIMLASVLPAEWLRQHEPPDDDAGNNRKEHDKWVSDLARWQGKAEFGALKIRDGQNGNWKVVAFDGPRMLFGERAIRQAEDGNFSSNDEFR